jgi:hypothetical protein
MLLTQHVTVGRSGAEIFELEPHMDHLRYSGAAPAEQLRVLHRIIESDILLPDILRRMEGLRVRTH